METTAEVKFKPEVIDSSLAEDLDKAAKPLRGKFFFSETAIRGSKAGTRSIGYDFPNKRAALRFLKLAKIILKHHGKKLTKAFTKETLA